ncbi:MAG: hypothetical protein GXZ06_10080 [Tissierellia bacterium]|nr:hypothetical protein [Tissierellia bacterium]
MKRFFGALGKTIGYWFMWLGLAALICPFLFPIEMWPQLKSILDIIVLIFPIGFVIRFIFMFEREFFERLLYLVKDVFTAVVFAAIPCLAVPIPFVIYHKSSYDSIIKGLIIIAIGIVGFILMDLVIKDHNKKKRRAIRRNE